MRFVEDIHEIIHGDVAFVFGFAFATLLTKILVSEAKSDVARVYTTSFSSVAFQAW